MTRARTRSLLATCFLGCLFFKASPVASQETYELGPDSKPREGVPRGTVHSPLEWNESRVYPGTERKYWVYVPAQFDDTKPACVLVVQDGLGRAKGWRLATVLDNLIHARKVPVQVGIFIDHGRVPARGEETQPRFNRSFEYDPMGGRYVRFLEEEILPAVSKRWKLSEDPNDRSIAGASSGGICAFTAAFERPDVFRRVLTTIGTFVGLRGGNEFPTLVRKRELRPIRVFLQDGRVAKGDRLDSAQQYAWVHEPDAADGGARGMTVDTKGRLYVATRLGVQVFDQLGRCHLILDAPSRTADGLRDVAFAGSKVDTLWALSDGRLFRRKLRAIGVLPHQKPVQPPKPGL